MKKLILVQILLIIINSSIISAQNNSYHIPFELTNHNNITINAIINNSDTVILMLHTASSSLTITEDAVKNLKNVQFNQAVDVKSWGGEANSARVSENNKVSFGEFKYKNITIWENKFSGPNTDGKFGLDLFKDKIINIDFENKKIIISNSLPDDISKYEKFKLNTDGDMMFLEAVVKINKVGIKNRFLIHSGYSGTILLDDKFVVDNKIGETLKIIGEKELKDSYGHIIKTVKAILPELKIGKIKLNKLPIGYFSGSTNLQAMSVMGGDVLKRFNIIFDSKKEFIYLKSNKLKRKGYSKN